jgi:hypothetical protein
LPVETDAELIARVIATSAPRKFKVDLQDVVEEKLYTPYAYVAINQQTYGVPQNVNLIFGLKVLPGDGFVNTTGSRLAHGGVTEVKDHLKILEKAEGGIYFIDEAYQLAEGHNYGGKSVLDFLLAEIENLAGNIVLFLQATGSKWKSSSSTTPDFRAAFHTLSPSTITQIQNS